jgi:hypothetical protein
MAPCVITASHGAVCAFPEKRRFAVGDLIDLDERGSWRVRSIENEPVDALPRLILHPVEPSDDDPGAVVLSSVKRPDL